MRNRSCVTEVVTLRGGLQVPIAALRLAWALEERGCTMRLDGDALIVQPRSLLSEADVARIRTHRDALRTIATYEAPEQ